MIYKFLVVVRFFILSVLLFFNFPLESISSPFILQQPFDSILRPIHWSGQRSHLINYISFGINTDVRNADGKLVDPLQIWSKDQDGLAMLQGYSAITNQGALAQHINASHNDGVRGHFILNGDFHIPLSASMTMRFYMTPNWTFSCGLPLYAMQLSHVVWKDQTQSITPDDILTKQLLTNDFVNVVASLGNNLDLQGWKVVNVGDIFGIFEWIHDFSQQKPWLKMVTINGKIGITIPTGFKKDENKILSTAFGCDGSSSIPFGAGITIRLKERCKFGVNAEFLYIFPNTKDRRIKTAYNQTDFLLLTKSLSTISYGITQKLTLSCEPIFYRGFSIRTSYQYVKHSRDDITVHDNQYSTTIANSANYLYETTAHSMLLQALWDAACYTDYKQYAPQISFFGNIPFNGTRSLQMTSIGCSFVAAF